MFDGIGRSEAFEAIVSVVNALIKRRNFFGSVSNVFESDLIKVKSWRLMGL